MDLNLATLRVVLFDADNTLRRCTVPGQHCPNDGNEWELLPDVRPRIQQLLAINPRVCLGIVSNQGGIHSGKLSADMASALLEQLAHRSFFNLSSVNPHPRYTYLYCPHSSKGNCFCRKPSPALLLDAARVFESPCELPIQRTECLYVGDMTTDMQAAWAAGFHFAWACEFFGREQPCEGKAEQIPVCPQSTL